MLRRMGPIQGVLKMIPGLGKQLEGMDEVDEKQLGRVEAIILSMTPKERGLPKVIDGSRPAAHRARIGHDGGGSEPPDGRPQADGKAHEGHEQGQDADLKALTGQAQAPAAQPGQRKARNPTTQERQNPGGNCRPYVPGLDAGRIEERSGASSRRRRSCSPRDGKFIDIVGRTYPQH